MKHNIYSNEKIFGHPDKIAAFRSGTVTAPIYVRIKPTNRCNHGCHWCVYSDGTKRPKDLGADQHLQSHMHEAMDERDIMPVAKAMELLADLRDMGTKAVTFSGGGEPLAHAAIVEIMELALAYKLQISIITNGELLSGKRAEVLARSAWVRISMDYIDPAGMSASRNTSFSAFERVAENIQRFSTERLSSCDLGVNFIVTRENADQVEAAGHILKGWGVDNVRFSPVYCSSFAQYHEPIREKVEEQLRELRAICGEDFEVNSTYDLTSASKQPHRPFNRCRYMETVPVVGADLGVYACHNTAYSKHGRIGSIKDRSFKDLWYSLETAAFFAGFDPSRLCNHECANHSKVELFNHLAESPADNFV